MHDILSDDLDALIHESEELLEASKGNIASATLKLKSRHPDGDTASMNLALDIANTRRKLTPDATWAPGGYLTSQMLQQGSSPVVAAHHASRYAGASHVLEVCAGAGFDTCALSRVAKRVTTIESDPIVAACLARNLALQEIHNVTILQGRAEEILPSLSLSQFDGVFADPSRRSTTGDRIKNPDSYHPPLSTLLSLPSDLPLGVKVSPAVDIAHADVSREWIGVGEECVEQTLWRGLSIHDGTTSLVDRDLQYIPRDASREDEPPLIEEIPIGGFLVEPHSALIRSGSLRSFFRAHSLSLLDPQIAYGISTATISSSPWWRAFRILDCFPFSLRTLRQRVGALGWDRRTEIKKRGFFMEPDELRKRLSLPPRGTESGVIFVTRRGDAHVVILARRSDLSELG